MLFQEQGLVRCLLRGEDAVLPADVSKTAILVENILVPVQDCAHDQRIIGVADFRSGSAVRRSSRCPGVSSAAPSSMYSEIDATLR